MSRPNILLLATDSQQARTIAPETQCQTPNIDRLSREGSRFTRCYSSNQICSPSRASLMTGVLPHNHGVVRNLHVTEPYKAQLREDVELWSERLSDHGYYVGHIGKWHVERSDDLGGFDYDEYELPGSEEYDEGLTQHRRSRGLAPFPDYSPESLQNACVISQEGYDDKLLYGTHDEPEGTPAHYLYSRGIEFIRERGDRSEPWCLSVNTSAPHDPFLAPAEIYDRYDPDSIPKPPNFDDGMQDKPEFYRRLPAVWEDLSWEEYAEAIAHYYAYCTHVDEQVGRIMDALEETGQLENTVVIFLSDHGDMMGGHRLFTHCFTAFEELYHSPLVIRWPGVERGAGEPCNELVQIHDIAPTLVDVAEAGEFPPEENTSSVHPRAGDKELYTSYRSTSLVPFLRGERPEGYKPEAYAEYDGDSVGTTQRIYWDGEYKYVFNMFAGDELYNLSEDPGETMNLADEEGYRERKEEMTRRVWEIAEDTGDYALTTNHYWMYRIAPTGPDSDA